MAVEYLASGSDDGVSLGRSATDKVAFHNATPVAQQALTTVPVSTAATNSTPYGFVTAAQADALVAWVRAADTALRAKGLIS